MKQTLHPQVFFPCEPYAADNAAQITYLIQGYPGVFNAHMGNPR